jgi:PAS domain S-box-containing protein
MAIAKLNSFRTLGQTLIKRLLPLLLSVLASLAVLLMWQQLTINEELHIEQLTQQEANAIELQLSKELSSRMLTLQQMANRWQVSGGTGKDLWEADAAAYIHNFYGYQAIEWVDPSFKVRWVVPLAGNEVAQNLDLSREPRRQIALQVARDLREIVLTHNISLPQMGKGFLAIFPLFVGDRFDGFIVGVFQFQTLFDSILRVPPGYKVAIYDRTDLIYSQNLPSQPSLQKTVVVKTWRADWRVEVFPTPELITKVKSSLPIVVLIGGLFLVWLFGLVVYLVQVSYRQIHEVKKANHQLQWEIYQRQQVEIENARLAAIVETSEDAILSKDLEGLVTSWNLGAERIFGYTEIEMLGQSGTKLIPADYQEQENQIISRIYEGERIEHYDTKRLRKDGTLIDVSMSVSPIKDETGNVIGASKIARNIADRKQAEVALQESEASYRQLINNLSAGFVIHATDTSILLCNATACELLGLSMDQMLGKTAIDLAWHFLREDGTVMPIEEYPAYRVLSTGMPMKNYVLGIQREKSSLVWVLVNAYPEFDINGQLKQVVITFIDISDRKKAEDEIQQTRNFLQALLDHLPVAIFVKDGHPENFGAFQFWNKTSEQLFGISAEQAIGKTDYDFFPIEQAKYFYEKDQEIFVKGSVEDILEELIDSHSLGQRWLHTVKVPIYDAQNQPHYLLGFSEDITDRKQAEMELREMSEVMKNAVSGISKIDPQGHYLYVNKAYADVTGYQPEEMIGMPWVNTVHPEELEKLIAAYWQMVEEGRVEVETRGVRKDGSVFYKQLVMISTYDEQHQFLGHYCFMKDISDRKKAEIALEKELLRTKTFFNTSMDGVVIMDRHGKVVEASPSFALTLGYTLEEILNLSVCDWDAKWTKEELQIILETEEIMPLFETQHRRKDGSVYDVENSLNRVELDGEMMNFCICRDISDRKRNEADRKQAEIDLQISQARFAGILEIASDAIISININQQITLFNKGAERIFGYAAEEVLGQPLMLLMPSRFANAHDHCVSQYAHNGGEAREMAKRGGIFGRRKDGTEFPAEASISKLDLNGEIVFTTFLRDISDRKQAEESLRYQKEMFQAIVDNIPMMIALFDWQGQIELLNPELEKTLGWSLEDWQQKDILAECYPDPVDRQSVIDFMLSATGKWQDLKTMTATGQQLETTWANVRLSDGHFLGIGQDISDRKHKEIALRHAMEAAESANLAKSIFLANMSHELRTPLNVILGFTQVMAHDPSLTPNQLEDLQTIRRSGDHLLSLINDVLDLSKIESGHCTIEESGFDLIALLHSLRNMLAERASSKGLDLCFEIAPEVPQFILADPQKLRQVLINLLSNAIKFTDRGSITLRVSVDAPVTEATHKTGLILQFAVIDTGVGIAPEELHTIFDAFVQAQAGKRSVSGTGLGLTISRKLLELMGGEISVGSILGEGSTFTFTLPVTPTSGVNITTEQNDRLVIGLVPGQSHRILVVDDRPENRLLMVRLLAQLGLEVREASNGLEAVKLWREWLPDLTWMDIRMPLLDGYEATKQIRAMEQGQTSIIIALTAQASQSDRTLALAAGCNDYISKPFREQTLFLKMAQYLGLEYVYQEQGTENGEQETDRFPSDPSSVTPPGSHSLDPTLLATLPEALLAQLEDAAVCGNDGEIAELAAQFSPELAGLGTRLTELANQYQFEQIIRLIHG